jgi:ketosteroid isomerase-like protein
MSNQDLINKFYNAFQAGDYQAMQACYADEVNFSDAVFQNLNSKQVKAMWHMLSKAGKVIISYDNITTEGNKATCHWTAAYTFSITNRAVLNRIDARFLIKDGLIIEHRDTFNIYDWSKQAFGITGYVLGWTNMFQNTIRKKATSRLLDFISKHPEYQD